MGDNEAIDTDVSETVDAIADGLLDMQHDACLHIECLNACWRELQTVPVHEGVARSIKTLLARQHAVQDALRSALAECRATRPRRALRQPAAG